MTVRDTEILLNLKTGEVRRNVITADQRFRFHEGFTEADMDAGWKQVSTFGAGCSEDEIAEAIEKFKTRHLAMT